MTERPDGTPGASPDEPEAAPEAETDTGAPEAPAALTEELASDTAALDDEGDAAEDDEIEDELEAEEADDEDEAFEDEPVEPLGSEPAAAAGAAATGAGARRRQVQPPSVQRAPTQSELAVRVTDNASRIFVIVTTIVFAAILAWGLLGGNGGLFSTPQTPSVAPSVSAPASPSPSA